jgi:hypothetical protein
MLLVLFPAPAPERRPARLEAWLPLAGAVIVVGITLYALFVEKIDVGSGGAKVDRSTLPLSLLALGAYVYYIADRTPVTRIAAGCRPHGFVVIGVFFGLWLARVALLAVMAAWFANTLDIMPLKSFMLGSFVVAVAKPAAFLVAHVVSFGPAFLLFLRYLRPLLDAAATHSAGAARPRLRLSPDGNVSLCRAAEHAGCSLQPFRFGVRRRRVCAVALLSAAQRARYGCAAPRAT